MAASFQEDSAQQHSLRIGDTVMLYAKETHGYVCSELSSPKYNSLFIYKVDSITDANLPNVHFGTFEVVAANKYKAQSALNEVKKRIGNQEPDTFQTGELLKAEKALQFEMNENQVEQARLQGSNIVYGEKVQLQHMLSKKYLYVNTTKTSRTENTNLRVELTDENREGCIFKILPRYKVRSVGDEVRYNDQVKFESVKNEGQFLHCSAKTYGSEFKVLEYRHEVNLSATESSFTLIPHYRPMSDHKPKAFRAGGTVRLFHREMECYLSAEGSFAEGPAVIENVHGRKRHSDHGKLKKPSTSANVYWQFEKERDSRSGEPLSWGERCRIKHLPTRCYLAVVQDTSGEYTVTLKEQLHFDPQYGTHGDLDTIFSLSPVIQEGDSIEVESYARIKHLHSRTWLHLEKAEVYDRVEFDPTAPGLDGLQWDSAELYKLTASRTMNYDDAFTLEEVSEDLLDKFNYVAGIVPILTTHVQTYGVKDGPTLTSKEAHLVKSALEDLSEFMSTPHERENKNRQKLLRNLRILELIIKVLKPFKTDAKDKNEQRVVCQACYKVITSYLDGDSRKNENYLARFVSFFKQQVQMDLNAEEVMIQMVEDNAAIVAKMSAEGEIKYMIQKLVETMDPRFMEFLGNLCVCGGRPIPTTQKTILTKLIEEQGKKVFYHTELGGTPPCPNGTKGVVYFKLPNAKAKDWKPLTDIADEEEEFLQRQLTLFAKLCQGNNVTTIPALSERLKMVTFKEVLACAKNDQLRPSLRSKYVELMIVVFVDVGENRAALENLTLSFVYQKVVEKPYESTGGDEGASVALTGVENPHFPDMKTWICSHLEQAAKNSVITDHEHVEENLLLAKVIEVLELLVKYGYYDDLKDVNAVLGPLIKVLNGFSDLPFIASKESLTEKQRELQKLQLTEFKEKGGRYKETETNKPIFTIKKKAMEVIDLFLNFRFYVRLQRFIYDFRCLNGDLDSGRKMDQQRRMDHIIGMSGRSPNLPQTLPPTGEVNPPSSLLALQYSSKADFIDSDVVVQMVRKRLEYIFSLSAYTFESPDFLEQTFADILLDVANYKDNELIQSSLYLLSRYYSSELTLFQKAIQTQLLVTPKSERVFEEVEEELQSLRRHLSINVKAKEQAEIVRILSRFSEMCRLDGNLGEPHPQNQKILYNSGILTDVLDYILQQGKSLAVSEAAAAPPPAEASEDQVKSKPLTKRKKTKRRGVSARETNIEKVFVECYKFLKALAKNHPEVQRRLYDRMDDLLEVEIAVPHMAEMLAEVFTGGLELCLKVKEEQIERLFQLVSHPDQDGVPELLFTLQAMAKVEELDKPLKRNQELIVKLFSKTREKFCDHVLGRHKERRWELLSKADDDDPDLRLLLAMTDLLASCAEGENLFIESVCQTILSVQELMEILNSLSLLPERKRPFARFLVYVYMNTAEDKYSTGASELTDTDVMRRYLEHLSVYLKNLGQVLRTVAPDDSQKVREGFIRSTTIVPGTKRPRGLSKSTGARQPTTGSSALQDVQFVTTKDGHLLPGVLFYLSTGVLPLLAVYYDQFFKLPTQQDERIKQLTVTSHILSALLDLSSVVVECFTLDSQFKLYRATVLTILRAGGGEIPLPGIDDKVLKIFEMTTKSGRAKITPTRAAYRDDYKEEIELNEAFNKFVANYQHAYEGPNKASAQIQGVKYTTKTVYSEGDECLPLGPSFQALVALFVNPSSTGSQRELVKPHLERLLTQLEISFNAPVEELDEMERRKQDALDITCLQVLRAVIHNEVMRIDPMLKENSPSGYRKRCTSKLHPLQNKIQDFGNTVARVVPILSHTNGEIVREVLAFLKAMLYSGNRHVQKGIEFVLETREERLFTTMRSLLQQAAATFTEKNVLLAQVTDRENAEKLLFGNSDVILSLAKGKEFEASLRLPKASTKPPLPKEQSMKQGDDPVFVNLGSMDDDSFAREDQPVAVKRGRGRRGNSFSPSISEGASLPREGRVGGKGVHFEMKTLQRAPSKEKHPVTEGATIEADQHLQFEDAHHIKLALKVLGLMCDGQFRVMQNYLREQKDNIVSVNVVGEVALFIQHFYLDINAQTMELVHLILQTLIEMCVGNYPNQLVIFNRQILEALNHIFQLDVSDAERRGYTIKDSVNLKGSAIELLEAMLERTDKKTKKLVKEIAKGLDIDGLHGLLAQFSAWKDDRHVQAEKFDDEAEQGMFRTYHVLVHLTDYGVPTKKVEPVESEDDEKKKAIFKAWQFCERQSKSVEVFYKNMDGEKILTRVHFPFNPDNELRDEVVEKVKWNVSRDSPEDKLRDFMEWMKAVKRDTLHSTRLHKFLPTKILTAFPLRRHQLLIFWTFLMNLFVIMSFAVPPESLTPRFNLDGADNQTTFSRASGAIRPNFLAYWRGSYQYALYAFSIIHLIMSLWMVVEYFVVNWPNFRLPKFYYRLKSRLKKARRGKSTVAERSDSDLKESYEETYSDIPIFGLQTLYNMVFLLCSIMSIPFYGYFYCLCLLHIIVNNDILQRVLRSITKNGKSLLWVAVLGFIILFIYSVVSFAFLHESFLAEGNNDGDLFCSTLYECYASVIRYGLIDNIGLIVPLVPTEFGVAALRLLYDVSFFIIVTTIGLNIVFGIIVDTFSELRDERYRIEEDKKSMCFICSLPSHEFERRASGFDKHVQNDHNMWNYIYYSIYLDQIDISDHNAIEGHVYRMIKEDKIEFFPLFESTVLEKEEDKTAKQLKELKEMVKDVLQRFREEEHKKARQTKRQEQQRWEEENFWKDQPGFDPQASIDLGSAAPPAGRSASISSPRQASFDGHQSQRRFRGTSTDHPPSYL